MFSEQKVAIITGASQGIGAGAVQAYRKLGYAVVANSRHITSSADPGVLAVPGDIADPETGARLVDRAVERFGQVDTLVNNAGVFVAKSFTDYTQFCDPNGLKGARIGVARKYFGFSEAVEALMEQSLDAMKKMGATLVDPADIPTLGKFGDSGVRMEISPKAEAAMNRTRLGPNAIPIQTAAGATSIWAADCTVVIQAPSSNPAWTAPRISASPKVESRPFSVEMNVPMSTANKPSHGIWVGPGGKPGGPGGAARGGSGAGGAGSAWGGLPSSGFWTCSLIGARGPAPPPGRSPTCREPAGR